jgi:pimeloyl-ACP methyl ester carboxylesterase
MPPRTPRPKDLGSSEATYWPPVAISIHGIRTHGKWQKVFASTMGGSPTKTESFEYGRYGLFRFLVPPFNRLLIDKFYNWYAQVINSCRTVDLDCYDKRPSIVAHSLGSWIVGYAMLKHEDVRFDKLILAGSILPRDFDWGTLFSRNQVAFVRNECGQQDPWPAWAGRLVAHTGTGGSEGFEWFSTAVENIPCDWSGHSDSLMRQHIEKHWIPTLRRRPSPLFLVHGRNINDRNRFSEYLGHTGAIDTEVYGNLPHFADIADDLALAWARINPDIYTFLIDSVTGKPAGYINAMPVDDAGYAGIRRGALVDTAVAAENVLPYVGTGPVKVYLMSLAVAEQYRQWGEGVLQNAYVQLLTGFLSKLIWYAKVHRVRVTHFLATAWTVEGRRMCQQFAMTEIGKDQFGNAIFELDLRVASRIKVFPALKRLLCTYDELGL